MAGKKQNAPKGVVQFLAEIVTLIIFVGIGEVGMDIVHLYEIFGNNWGRPARRDGGHTFKQRATA